VTPETFAAAPIRMVDVAHPDGTFPRIRQLAELLFGRRPTHGSRIQARRDRFALYAWSAAAEFDAAGDDRSAAACRGLAEGATQ